MATFAFGNAYTKYSTQQAVANLFAVELSSQTQVVEEGYRLEVRYLSGSAVTLVYRSTGSLPATYELIRGQMTSPEGEIFYSIVGPIKNLTSEQLANFEFWKEGNDLWTQSVPLTINDNIGDDTAIGSFGPDIISLGQGNDLVQSGLGNDVIDPGSGNDMVEAGDGNDTISISAGNDLIDGGKGTDYLNILTYSLSSLRFELSDQKLNVSIIDQPGIGLTLTNIERIVNTKGDSLQIDFGSAAADTLSFSKISFGFDGDDYPLCVNINLSQLNLS
jgi:Ca2+-binding RTX toxin-like protein